MTIIYRDKLGQIAVDLDQDISIGFSGGMVYFTDISGEDYTIEMANLVEIIPR